ncbi:MAG: hypothetical protein N3B18_03715 [Desulfobacterota bacterium]|nr:hypothetical protein [Thermodesulfobacteriota bacterium]
MKGIAAFIIFLFIIPLGHILTAAALKLSVSAQIVVILSGFAVAVAIMYGTKYLAAEAWETFWGLVAGVLLWACLFEMGFRLSVKRFNMNDVKAVEVTLVPIIPLLLYFLFNENIRCPLFTSLRNLLCTRRLPSTEAAVDRWCPRTAVKVFLIMWIGHVVLYYTYDPDVFGERGLFVKFFFAFCLGAGGYMFYRLTKASEMGYAFRYAIPTVITIWCCVETISRWRTYPDPMAVVDAFLIGCIAVSVILLAVIVILSERKPRGIQHSRYGSDLRKT